ncbi:MAG TPA: glutathione S-transferase N-terminal domain-containing protein [Xanthobacteraceae bacterium]
MLELYHDWSSFCSIKVRLCLAEKNLPWESRFVDLMKLGQLKPDYLRLNPNAVVPTLVQRARDLGIELHQRVSRRDVSRDAAGAEGRLCQGADALLGEVRG